MNTSSKKSIFTVVALAFLTAGCLISCKQNTQNGPTVHEMQTRLDEIMKEYQEMQQSCDEYSQQLAQRDSSIQAQAAEIQNLIDQLNNSGSKGAATTKTARGGKASGVSSAKLRKLNAQLEAKKAEIVYLQQRLDQQTAELDALRNTEGFADRETIARLRRQVKEQDARIVALTNDKVALTNINDSLTAHMAYLLGQRPDNSSVANAEATAQIALLQGQVATQQAEITRLQEELANQIALVNEANESARNAKAAAEKAAAKSSNNVAQTKGAINKKLAQLQAQCDEYVEELARLRAENAVLRTENDSLRNEVVAIRRNAENVAVENAKMAARVSRASVLSTADLSVTPLKRLSNGTGRPTSRASATNAFRIEGHLLANNVVEPGTITIYAVITSPSNVALHNGTVEQKFDANGVRTTYTTVQAFEFTGDSRQFDMNWSKDDDMELEAGIYRLNLYANGNLIGVTEFKLK
ncbi:MAG: hypothetical protein IJK84_09275 [Bacteroidales bacterium]|nr:hypothetical protein [Bacteroidales bacterium]